MAEPQAEATPSAPEVAAAETEAKPEAEGEGAPAPSGQEPSMEEVMPSLVDEEAKKHISERLKEGDDEGKKSAKKRKREKKKKPKGKGYQPPAAWFELKKNTSVYISGLPVDTTTDEVMMLFKKAGMIKRDPISTLVKIKLYKDAHDELKGDGLVTYVKPESVELAVQLLHETPLRTGSTELLSVQPAKFEQKGEAYNPKNMAEARKAAKKAAVNAEKKFGWHGDDEDPERPTVIVVKKAFRPDEFRTIVNLKQDLYNDFSKECGEHGTVQKIKVYDRHPEGVISVKFADWLCAQRATQAMNGRLYAGQRLEVQPWDYRTDYRKQQIEDDNEKNRRTMTEGEDKDDLDSDEEEPPSKKQKTEEDGQASEISEPAKETEEVEDIKAD